MGDGSKNLRNVAIGIICVVGLSLAIWSGVRTFGPQGRTIGTLGAITEKTNRSESANTGATKAAPAETEKTGEAALSGAPSDATPKQP